MTLPTLVRPLCLAFAVGAASVGASGPAQAGLFDFLFGGAARPAQQYYAPSYGAPLDVRVNPQRRRRESVQRRPSDERGAKVVNTSIDPRKHPNWHLEDPTLRRGDIVVLPTGAMVYQGGPRPQTREDFSKLSDSRTISRKERDRIENMVGPPTVTAETAEPLRNKEAAVPSNPLQ